MLPITFNVDANKALLWLDKIIKRVSDITPDLKANEEFVLSFFQENLTAQKNPDGSSYQDLSTLYRKSKAYKLRKRLSPKPLDTKNYRDSFQAKSIKNEMSIFSDHPGILTHENGLTVKIFNTGISFKFPKRSAIWLSKTQIDKLSSNLGQRLVKFNG